MKRTIGAGTSALAGLRPENGLRAGKRLLPRKRPWLIAAGLILALCGVAFAAYFQSFETDTNGWFGATRVMSGTHTVPSKAGAFHAEDGGGAFTRWGGYSDTFPVGGYTTSIDIYLDTQAPYGDSTPLTPYPNDTRFDWSSAINNTMCDHRRDFVFNVGFYTDMDFPGAGPRFVISASNNATRSGANPRNPSRNPITIADEGWFTFEHRFIGVPGGQLTVVLTVKDSFGVQRGTWTLTDPSDIIGTTVGGNRYGWFVIDEFPFLAFDNSALIGFQDFCTLPPSTPGAKITGGGWIDVLMGKGTFGLTAKASNSGTPSGNLTYQDHGVQDRTVKSTAITSVTVSGNCAQILGTATVNGAGAIGFQVQVCDNGEPGDTDTFSIIMSDSYTAAGTLRGGNIQIH
ncbi:MAG TPA: post-COAP-1 domain-containing protein [Pyrinomonadaceae bacterium]|nr:post-COAP-1 domain-containing protein [Pyrinomonadaceae bacterium]